MQSHIRSHRTHKLLTYIITFVIIFFVSINLGLRGGGRSWFLTSFATEKESNVHTIRQEETDIIFVIDFSNSMNGNDRDKTALQMIEACIDMLYVDKMRVGFVAYDDRILDFSSPISISEKTVREELKKRITSIPRSGSTDIGLALKKAEELVRENQSEPGRKTHIILLSDGEPDLTYSKTGRTMEQSYAEMYDAADQLGSLGIVIDSIAFGNKFGGETSCLNTVSSKSNGTMYTAKTPDILIDIFGEVISKYTFSSLCPTSLSIAGGKEQVVELPIKDTFADEVNILAISSKPLQDITIVSSGEEVTYAKSGYYFTSKIKKPDNETIKLQIHGDSDQEIKIYLVLYRDLEFNLEIGEQAEKNNLFPYKFYFSDGARKIPLAEEIFYKQFAEDISIVKKDSEGGEEILALEKVRQSEFAFEDHKLSAEEVLKQSGTYFFRIKITGNYYSAEIKDIPLQINNSPPTGEFALKLKYLRADKEYQYDLNEYFSDANGDALTYELFYLSGSGEENIRLEGNLLNISSEKSGKAELIIRVIDIEGDSFESQISNVYIEPFWKYYLGIIIGIVIVLLMLLVYAIMLWRRRKNIRSVGNEQEEVQEVDVNTAFRGKLNVYFTKLPDDMEVDPLTFALYQLKDKKVTLGQLLEILELPLEKLDAYNICLIAGPEKELILTHTSKSGIMVGSSILCKKLKYSIDYGNKIYITSQEGEYELEIHYLSVRS